MELDMNQFVGRKNKSDNNNNDSNDNEKLEEMKTDSNDSNENKYLLYGVINHQGQASHGHYFAYIRDLQTMQW